MATVHDQVRELVNCFENQDFGRAETIMQTLITEYPDYHTPVIRYINLFSDIETDNPLFTSILELSRHYHQFDLLPEQSVPDWYKKIRPTAIKVVRVQEPEATPASIPAEDQYPSTPSESTQDTSVETDLDSVFGTPPPVIEDIEEHFEMVDPHSLVEDLDDETDMDTNLVTDTEMPDLTPSDLEESEITPPISDQMASPYQSEEEDPGFEITDELEANETHFDHEGGMEMETDSALMAESGMLDDHFSESSEFTESPELTTSAFSEESVEDHSLSLSEPDQADDLNMDLDLDAAFNEAPLELSPEEDLHDDLTDNDLEAVFGSPEPYNETEPDAEEKSFEDMVADEDKIVVASETMARIFEQQEKYAQAIQVYYLLIDQPDEPADLKARYKDRINELQSLLESKK